MIGFAHKKNAKRTLENNFIKDEDYKILLLRTDDGNENLLIRMDEQVSSRNLGGAGLNKETVMLNIDTFKSL